MGYMELNRIRDAVIVEGALKEYMFLKTVGVTQLRKDSDKIWMVWGKHF